MTERIERINSLVKQEIGFILQHDLKNSKLGFVTVLRADISKDLKSGRIFVSIMGDTQIKSETIDILNKSAGYIQKMLGSRVRLRYMPKLKFIYDDVIEHSIHIQEVLDKINKTNHETHTDENNIQQSPESKRKDE